MVAVEPTQVVTQALSGVAPKVCVGGTSVVAVVVPMCGRITCPNPEEPGVAAATQPVVSPRKWCVQLTVVV